MPVGGVQSQNHTQGLVHWMSAVMAEHMTSNSHHDPTVGMHYMWNGGVDVSTMFLLICLFIFSSLLCSFHSYLLYVLPPPLTVDGVENNASSSYFHNVTATDDVVIVGEMNVLFLFSARTMHTAQVSKRHNIFLSELGHVIRRI